MAFIKATKRHYRSSTRSDSINQTHLPQIIVVYFIVKLPKKAPYDNRGMTYQIDEKHLTDLLEYFVGVVKPSMLL